MTCHVRQKSRQGWRFWRKTARHLQMFPVWSAVKSYLRQAATLRVSFPLQSCDELGHCPTGRIHSSLSHSWGVHALPHWLALANGIWADLKQREVSDVPTQPGLFCCTSVTLHERNMPQVAPGDGRMGDIQNRPHQIPVWGQAQVPQSPRPRHHVQPSLDPLSLCARSNSFCFSPPDSQTVFYQLELMHVLIDCIIIIVHISLLNHTMAIRGKRLCLTHFYV